MFVVYDGLLVMGKNQVCYFIVMKVLCCSTVSREWLCTPELVSGDGNGSSRGHLSPFSLYLLG